MQQESNSNMRVVECMAGRMGAGGGAQEVVGRHQRCGRASGRVRHVGGLRRGVAVKSKASEGADINNRENQYEGLRRDQAKNGKLRPQHNPAVWGTHSHDC